MNPQIRLISPSPRDSRRVTFVVTSDPSPFSSLEITGSIRVFSHAEAVFQALQHRPCDQMFCDFRTLDDKWTGQKYLRELKKLPQGKHIEFWLMADEWLPMQNDFVISQGAAGFINRTPDAVARKMRTQDANEDRAGISLPSALTAQMSTVDRTFMEFAGSIAGPVSIGEARQAMSDGDMNPDIASYIADLSQRLLLPIRKSAFLTATQDLQSK